MTQEACIQIIKQNDRVAEFEGLYGMSPEDFFNEYNHQAPQIYFDVLNGLNIEFEI